MKPLIYILLFLLALIVSDLAIQAHYKVDSFDWSYTEELKERSSDIKSSVSSQKEEGEVAQPVPTSPTNSNPAFSAETEAMLNWVTMCESSNRHEVWGAENEFGILQWKKETWDWLSEVLDYEGDWKNKDDQIELFLLAVDAGYGRHWTCWRKYQNK